ncbi:hypothetical protein V5N11_001827 [Cardamine amara subsp. amara]|uniref:Arabidopsis retrotransposon Orf1 C-terminal domain-containing protein n=1 Tax=Cardamine amara subsp. amara TaxID=228776 RepID=A0ABD1BL80_CARAN
MSTRKSSRIKRARKEEISLSDDDERVLEATPSATITTIRRPSFLTNSHVRFPWPKLEVQKIKLQHHWDSDPRSKTSKSECIHRPILENWDDYDSMFYNAWQDVDMRPTRLEDKPTIVTLGIEDDVSHISVRIGLGMMPYDRSPLYPNLARQFLASCHVYYADENAKVAQQGVLTFMCKGMRYRITLTDLCDLYGFKRDATHVTLDTEWDDIKTLWSHIGNGEYDIGSSKQMDVRHPAIRYVLRIIASTILCKSDPTKARKSDLMLLLLGIRHMFPAKTWRSEIPNLDLNLGAVFAHHLVSLKTKAFHKKQFEHVGSLLTPIFSYFDIILSNATRRSDSIAMDHDYLKNVTWMKPNNVWVFVDEDGKSWNITLPVESLEIRRDHTRLYFTPDESLLVQGMSRKLRRGSSSNTPLLAIEDETVPLQEAPAQDQSSVFPEPPAGYEDDGPMFRKYMVDTMRSMWQLIASSTPPTSSHQHFSSQSTDTHTPRTSDDDMFEI